MLEFVDVEFKRVGKLAAGETEAAKYKARQIKPESFPKDSAEAILNAALEVTDGNLEKIAEALVSGLNHHMRLEAGGYDEWQKAARKLQASGIPGFANKSLEDIVTLLKAQANA